MSLINRFSDKIYGGVVFTGNTLGVSKKEKELLAGTHHSIGAFITTDEDSCYKDFGPGTTGDYTLSRSSAILSLTEDVNILYAELIWGGRSELVYESKEYTIKERINDDILFWIPKSNREYRITPCLETRIEDGFSLGAMNNFYTRSADVTKLIKEGGTGQYSVGCVPSLLFEKDAFSFAGWTLAVVYEHKLHYEFRQIHLYVGGKLVEYKKEDYQLLIEGLNIPKEYQNIGKIYLSAGMGGFRTLGGEVYFGNSENSNIRIPLKGVNNLPHQFFASQINDESGNLDKRGTKGEKNHQFNKDTKAYTGIVAARQGWDITSVDISSHVEALDRKETAIFHTEGASYYLNAVAIDVDAIDTSVWINKQVDKHGIREEDEVTVTLTISNTGSHVIKDVYITDYFPKEMTLIDDGICIANQKTGHYENENKINFMIGEVTPLNLGGMEVSVGYKLKTKSLSNFVDYKSLATVTYYVEELGEHFQVDSNMMTLVNEGGGLRIQIEQVVEDKEIENNEIEDSKNDEFQPTKEMTSRIEKGKHTIHIKEIVENITTKTISNIVVLHKLSENAKYNENLLINGNKSVYDLDSGIVLESLLSSEKCILEYSIQVVKDTIDNVSNQVKVSGIYKEPKEDLIVQLDTTKLESIKLYFPKLEIDKISDKVLIGKPGDRINFTLTISNTGNLVINNIIVTDKIQEGMTYVKNSTRINQGDAFQGNPEKGIPIGDLDKESSCVITYQAMLSK